MYVHVTRSVLSLLVTSYYIGHLHWDDVLVARGSLDNNFKKFHRGA